MNFKVFKRYKLGSHDVYLCSNFGKGDLVNWETAKWDVYGMDHYEASYSDICDPPVLGLVLIPGSWNISYARTLCKNIGGDINVVKDKANNDKLAKFAMEDSCKEPNGEKWGKVWVGWWDEQEEGVMSSMTNPNEKLSDQTFSNWLGGEPNGNTIENCVALFVAPGRTDGKWVDGRCYATPTCTACQVPKMPTFVIKGKEFFKTLTFEVQNLNCCLFPRFVSWFIF